MSYKEALEAAGANIVRFAEFGSYSGDWFAELEDGRYIHNSYGSCSGCDEFHWYEYSLPYEERMDGLNKEPGYKENIRK